MPHKFKQNKQAMRIHEVAKHGIMNLARAFMPATSCQCCMWEYHTKQRAIAHLKTINRCLPLLRCYAPAGIGYGKEVAKGIELTRQRATCVDWKDICNGPEACQTGR